MRSALLRGRECTELGYVAVEAEGPAGVALSRGGAKKPYAFRDPNEDAALFVTGAGGVLLAVADAHDGFAASEIVLDHLLSHPAADWIASEPFDPERWPRHALAALVDANAAVRREVQGTPPPHSSTTLSVALVRPDEDRLLWATIGDSHLFQVFSERAIDRGVRASGALRRTLGSRFLGWGTEDEASLAKKCRIGAEPLGETRAVAAVTDGISERSIGVADPEGEVIRCAERARAAPPERRPLELARGVVEVALAAHARQSAGDNVASAVAWLDQGALE